MKRSMKHYHPRDCEQVPTIPTTVGAIMAEASFERGVEDVRANRGYPADYDLWEDNEYRWSYERGRQWARLAQRYIKLKVNGAIPTQALGPIRSTRMRSYRRLPPRLSCRRWKSARHA
jgi:hypothetical protein